MTGFSANRNAAGTGPLVTRLTAGLVLVTLVLMGVTVINQFLIDPYRPVASPMTVIGADAITGGSGRAIMLENKRADHIIRRDFPLPPMQADATHIRVRAAVHLTDVAPGDRRWKAARVLVNRILPGGSLYWEAPHVVFRGKGNLIATDIATVLPASTAKEGMNVRVELLLATGRLHVSHLTVTPLVRSDGAIRSERFLLICWLALIVAWSVSLIRRRLTARKGVIVLMAWAMAITAIGLSTLPSGTSQPIFSFVWTRITLIRSYLPRPPAPEPVLIHVPVTDPSAQPGAGSDAPTAPAVKTRHVDISAEEAAAGRFDLSKMAHVGIFIIIGLLFAAMTSAWRGRKRMVLVAAGGVLFGTVTELMQTFAISRSPTLYDACLNGGGVVLGVIVLIIFARFFRRIFPHGND